MEHNKNVLPFLDIKVVRQGNSITTDIYYKPTDSKQYLNFKSNHPRHTKYNVPFNLARRICTIVPETILRERRLNELKTYLLQQNYPEGIIMRGIERAKAIPLDTLRGEREVHPDNKLAFVATYNPVYSNTYPAIKTGMNYLQGSTKMSAVLRETKIIRSYRQAPNLKQLLTKAALRNNQSYCVKKCADKRCKLCKENLLEGSEFLFRNKNLTFKVNANMGCNTKN